MEPDTVNHVLGDLGSKKLSVAEFAFFRDAAVYASDTELSVADAEKVIGSTYFRQFGRAVGLADLRLRLEQFSGLATLYRSRTNFSTVACRHGVQVAAMPAIRQCLQCGGGLAAGHEQGPTIFYDIGEKGVSGRLYILECECCDLVYQLDGYQHKEHYLRGGGEKLMYTREHEHGRWFRSTSQTVLSKSLIHLQEGMFNFGQTGFLPCAKTSSWVAINRQTGLLFTDDRTRLHEKRLTEGCLRYWVRESFLESAEVLLPNVNLKLELDVLVEMAETVLIDANRRRFFDHQDTSIASKWCGKYEQWDGHMKLCRSRCSSVLEEPAGLGDLLVSGEHLWTYRHCPETPMRKDKLGRCKGCKERNLEDAVDDPMDIDHNASVSDHGPPNRGNTSNNTPGSQSESEPEQLASAAALAAGTCVAIQDRCVSDPGKSAHCYLTRSKVRNLNMEGLTLPDPRGSSFDSSQSDLLLRTRGRSARAVGAAGNTAAASVAAAESRAAADNSNAGDGIALGDGLYAAERIEDEMYCYASEQVRYKVKWVNCDTRTWEPAKNIVVGRSKQGRKLYEDWKQRAVPLAAFQEDEADLVAEPEPSVGYSGPMPPTKSAALEAAVPTAASSKVAVPKATSALPKKQHLERVRHLLVNYEEAISLARGSGTKLEVQSMVSVLAVFHKPLLRCQAEGVKAILASITSSYRDEPMVRPGKDYKFFGFDDMCHLMRYAEKVRHLHPKIDEFVTKTRKVVDKFHFRNHVGEYCKKYANPYIWDELPDNMSVAEQYFKRQARFKRSMRYMNRPRFRFMLQVVCWLDQKARSMPASAGFVERKG